MPKLKSKSSAKKRFSFTGTGKVKGNVANKRHLLANKSQKMKRKARGTFVLFEGDDRKVARHYLPYGA